MRKLIVAIFIFALISSVYFYLLAEPLHINAWEIRYYVFIFIISVVVTCFGVLRIYNAVKVNSAIVLKIPSAFSKIKSAVDSFTRAVNKNLEVDRRNHKLYTQLKELLSSLNNRLPKI